MSNMETNTTSTALAIASSADNVGMIVRKTPESYRDNQLSHDNCLSACRQLLDAIVTAGGMTDELDQKASVYIEKTRRTLKAMNDRRAPVTKLFDQVRKEFTSLENDIDPTKAGTVPYQLQQLRNRYAAQKREEEERRRREEEARRLAEMARRKYREDCEADYSSLLSAVIQSTLNHLARLNSSVTLENYQAVLDTVSSFATQLPPDWIPPKSTVPVPVSVSPSESAGIRANILSALMPDFNERYAREIGECRQEILDTLPSKRAELERAAKASAEEAERIKAEIARREAADAARKEAERLAREQEAAKMQEVRKAGDQAASLFDLAQTSAQTYQPKAKVSKKIKLVAPDGILPVLMMWWAKEGSSLPVEELAKIFKKQVAFCEKVANKEQEFIKDDGIVYIDDVKAQ